MAIYHCPTIWKIFREEILKPHPVEIALPSPRSKCMACEPCYRHNARGVYISTHISSIIRPNSRWEFTLLQSLHRPLCGKAE